MTNGKVLGVDIDGTIVNTLSLWGEWKQLNPDKDHLGFWRNSKLYDNLEPSEDAIHYIKLLSNDYHIHFISDCFEEHLVSKIQFLQKYFDNFSFTKTKHKHNIRVDVMIDDRESTLVKMEMLNCVCMKANLDLVTSENFPVLSWKDIYTNIKDINVRTK